MRVRLLTTATIATLASAMAACATARRHPSLIDERHVFEGATVEAVRRAAFDVVSERTEKTRVAADGRVIGDRGWAGYWASYEVRFVETDGGVAAEVAVERDRTCRERAQPSTRPSSRHPGAVIALADGGVERVPRAVADARHYPIGPLCPAPPAGDRAAARAVLDEMAVALGYNG